MSAGGGEGDGKGESDGTRVSGPELDRTDRSAPSPSEWTAPTGAGAAGALVPQLIHAGTGLPFSDKGRKTAGLLQILLCGFGAGRFYLGYPKVAVLQILVTWCTCGAGVLWPVIDGIRMLEGRVPDASGRPLRED